MIVNSNNILSIIQEAYEDMLFEMQENVSSGILSHKFKNNDDMNNHAKSVRRLFNVRTTFHNTDSDNKLSYLGSEPDVSAAVKYHNRLMSVK